MILGYFNKLRIWPICLGQLVSLCITGTSSASSALWQQHHVNIPFTQNTCMYFLLALTFGSWKYYNYKKATHLPSTRKQHAGSALLSQRQERFSYDGQQNYRTLNKSQSPYHLLLVVLFSIVDVQANVLAVTAFRNTSVLSALIISSWTLPCIMMLSVVLLKTRYQPAHFIGVVLGLVGLGFLIWGDMIVTASNPDNHDGDSSFPLTHSWLGDIICLISATLYAISNVTEEYLVHYSTSQDFLYRIGLTGMIQNGVLAWLFEYDTLTSINWSRHNVTLVLVYVLCLFIMYSLIPTIYRLAGAIFVGMSLVTSNFYSLLIGLVFLDAKMPPFYPLAYCLVIIGATLYNIVPPPVYHPQENEHDRNQNQDRRGHGYSGQRFEQLVP
ncbi:hypothetical protein BCR42DRAFT_423573 [Absidia repens]|uniref:Solute carrier family 35 member SLC35F1/F2/F6 n=1 Tax=Absidia repens TaxID=90262 RepID=A0A1X2I515_9FUNG|nr:hypothetical protein BCR42DRAFT_423573 [Absidia repens]